MTYVNVISVISLVILAGLVVIGVLGLVRQIRSKRYKFFKGYNYGTVALIFIPAFMLYLVAYIENGDGVLSIFSALNSMVEIVLLKYDTEILEALVNSSSLYACAVYTCFVVAALNTSLLVVSLAWHYIWEHTRSRDFGTARDVLIIYGLNEGSKSIYRSDSSSSKLIVDQIPKDEADKLYEERMSYRSDNSPEIFIPKYVQRRLKWNPRRENGVTVVVNGTDEKNLVLCKALVDMIRHAPDSVKQIFFKRLRIYVIGDPEYQSIYDDMISGGYGCLRYVNKYQRIAVDFIDKYPLSKFMTEAHVDRESALVMRDIDINVCFIGFGRVNREIFLTSIANNQFLEASDTDPVLKKVHYHIFDRECAEDDKNLNHSYYRFKHECRDVNQKDYLPLPSLPAEEHFHRTDVNKFSFYEELCEVCAKNPRDLNFIIIAFGTDLENIDLAQKLVEKRREWRLDNLHIFVKAEAFRKEDTFINEDGCYFIGYEAQSIYSIDNIIGDRIQRMAKYRNEVYATESYISAKKKANEGDGSADEAAAEPTLTAEELAAIKADADNGWYMEQSRLQRDSNIFACLSIRSKLNFMGLDYVPENDAADALSYEEYMGIYASADMPDVEIPCDGARPVVTYTTDFRKSKRRNLAIHEHQRWNSFMLSRGMIPSTLDQIEKETVVDKEGKIKFTNGKNYDERRHGNLTTFEGLVRFRRILAEREKKPEDVFDVIKYDYQLLDEAYWLLTSCGYKIVVLAPTVKARFALPLQDQAQQIR